MSDYNGTVTRADLGRFAERDWAAVERGKREYWAECYRRDGAGPAWRASVALLEHARRLGASGHFLTAIVQETGWEP